MRAIASPVALFRSNSARRNPATEVLQTKRAIPVRLQLHDLNQDPKLEPKSSACPGAKGLNWPTVIAIGLFHIGAIAALFMFSWRSFLVALFLYWVATGLGISMGYHRLHTHRGYKCPVWLEYFFALCGSLTLRGRPDFLGRGASRPSSEVRSATATRIRPGTVSSGRTWDGSCSATATTTIRN